MPDNARVKLVSSTANFFKVNTGNVPKDSVRVIYNTGGTTMQMVNIYTNKDIVAPTALADISLAGTQGPDLSTLQTWVDTHCYVPAP